MNQNISERIELLRFPLIVSIIYIHMYTSEFMVTSFDANTTLLEWFRYLISHVMAFVSVSLFFAISGYLFFINFKSSFSFFLKKYRSRFRTLVVPYTLWNITVIFFYLVAQTSPLTAQYFNGEHPYVINLRGWQYLEVFWGYGEFEYPIAFQFWFIRDLIVLVVLSPLLYLFLKKIPFVFLSFWGILWIFGLFEPNILHTNFFSIFFFSFGAYLALYKHNFDLSDTYAKEMIFLYLVLIWINLYFQFKILENVAVLVGTIAAFSGSKYIVHFKIKDVLIKLSKYSFFLFAIHEPMLSIVRKLSYKILMPESDISIFMLYILCPIVTIILCIYIYKVLEKWLPNILNILIGNRLSNNNKNNYAGNRS